MRNRRLQRIPFSADFLLSLLSNGEHRPNYLVENGLPNDSIIVGVVTDIYTSPFYWVLVSSNEFPEVKEGSMIPERIVKITTVH